MTTDLAARAGLWSARRRRRVLLGPVALLVAVTLAGGAAGIGALDGGDPRPAAAAAFPPDSRARVLVQARGSVRTDDPAFTAAVADVAARLRAVPRAKGVESPLTNGNERLMSADGRWAVVELEIDGDRAAALAAIAAAQRAHPTVRIGPAREVSAGKAPDAALGGAAPIPSRARW